jgi:hypothetical protein
MDTIKVPDSTFVFGNGFTFMDKPVRPIYGPRTSMGGRKTIGYIISEGDNIELLESALEFADENQDKWKKE